MKKKPQAAKENAGNLRRRTFFKILGAGSAMAVAGSGKAAAAESGEAMGVLVDTTMCVGCRTCEAACNEANKLPKPNAPFDDESVLEKLRDTSPAAFTVVNKYKISDDLSVTRKRQCMHCVEPACSSACIIKAMEKRSNGAVTYRDDLCIGCRYCMVACPFDVPKFEYSKALPLIRKCQFCFDRQKDGGMPACVENCPMGALAFGPRKQLIEEAYKRIYTSPDNYVHHVYGENEAGGTSWMYLAAAPFEKLGLPKLSSKPYPEYTLGAMSTVPMVLLIWPALLMGFHHFSHRGREGEAEISHNAAHGAGR